MSEQQKPCESAEFREFDFWVGHWILTWPASQLGGEEGDTGTGTNHIVKLFGRCGVEETFSTDDGAFQGRSFSVYDPRAGHWKQTWVDNQGGYLTFHGSFDGERMDLRTPAVTRNGETIIQRMVFRDIKAETLRWDWQGSRDGGKSWNDLWNISYRRA